MSLTLYGKLTADQSDRLEGIEADVDRILEQRVGRLSIWSCTDKGQLQLERASDSAVLWQMPLAEFDQLNDKAFLKRLAAEITAPPEAARQIVAPQKSAGVTFTGIYIYVDGSDLAAFAKELARDLKAAIKGKSTRLRVINELAERTPDLGPEDLPDWRLGLNVKPSANLADDLASAFEAAGDLAKKYGREFVVGYFDADSGITQDTAFFNNPTTAKRALKDVCKMLAIG